jgi:microcystin-dependent protein
MAYIGNTNTTQAFTPQVDFFSGNASTTAFTLSRPVASVAQVQAVIENVPQAPTSAFTVSGSTITFTSAPPSGTNNIYVYYTSPITQVITPGQGTVGLTQLSASGTASSATYLRGDNTWAAISGTPSGVVMFFAANSAPTGYLKANGAAVSRTTYVDLFTAIGTTFGVGDGSTTFNLPDLRGYFARGWVDNGSVDSGRAFGSTQTDAMQGHIHQTSTGISQPYSASIVSGLDAYYNTGYITLSSGNPVSNGSNGTPRIASETRPSNVAMLACIKY